MKLREGNEAEKECDPVWSFCNQSEVSSVGSREAVGILGLREGERSWEAD